MFTELPHNVVLLTVGAFLLGWILASISARLGSRFQARRRDPRDDRIRGLEAEYRVSQSSVEELRGKLATAQAELDAARDEVAKRDSVIAQQRDTVDKLKLDLRDSVRKTRELREELTERATENVRSEVKQRELETELSVARASTDLIATGVLDYSLNDDEDDLDTSSTRPPASRRAN